LNVTETEILEKVKTMFRSVISYQLSAATLLNLGLVGLALSGCINPPNSPCDSGSSSSSSSSSSGSSAPTVDLTKVDVPPGVVPTGTLISDGSNPVVQNIDPPGSWFMMNDHSVKGSMDPATNGDFPAAMSSGMVHTSGKLYTDWGGGIGLNFVGDQMLKPVDASKFKGIRFKASGSTPMHVGLATVVTMPEFGVCTKCYDHYAVDINDLSGTPKTYEFTWDKLHQSGWGAPKAKLDPKTIIGLNFTSKGPAAWDFSIDDLEWIK